MKRMRVSDCANIAFHPEPGDALYKCGLGQRDIRAHGVRCWTKSNWCDLQLFS